MSNSEPSRALTLATLAFVVSFAVWGLIAPMAKSFQSSLHLTEQQVWLLIAAPVLPGSLLRLPMGMLADRFGGRAVYGLLLMFVAIPAFMLSVVSTYSELLAWALLLGAAGASFSVGVAFVSRWFSPERQGLALGLYGAGNVGQSVALFGVPILAGLLGGWQATYRLFALVSLGYGALFLLTARNAPGTAKPKSARAMLRLLTRQPLSWLLALFYFVTFGGFVALSIGLPKLLQELFGLTRADAGLRVAGFVVLATAVRPVGGWLSDRVGGSRLLLVSFGAAAIMALGLTTRHIAPFTVGALGVAAAVGIGNGAVFKLVPQFFPRDTGTVTGLVGAAGGLGGFFPPLVLGILKANTGSYAAGFVLLSLFCAVCLVLDWKVLVLRTPPVRTDEAVCATPEPAAVRR